MERPDYVVLLTQIAILCTAFATLITAITGLVIVLRTHKIVKDGKNGRPE